MDTEIRKALQKSLGKCIKKIRLDKGLKQNEVARRCGFYKSNYNSIELGLRNVSLINIYKIAFALEEPISSFFDDVEFSQFLEHYNDK
ncbi:helix-turn-helix transcriptional regulator [Winogradskyella sp.]|uniref:helix-turn-helix domain-containing protein n=1 Tax=Winogradskyella sp. TaxID=1883156 RepID=UPI00261D2F08|nr:helix-turn-helix transcriptional regulator [Winogradskyella sp.]